MAATARTVRVTNWDGKADDISVEQLSPSQAAGSASAGRDPAFSPQSACMPISLTAPENTAPRGEPLSSLDEGCSGRTQGESGCVPPSVCRVCSTGWSAPSVPCCNGLPCGAGLLWNFRPG